MESSGAGGALEKDVIPAGERRGNVRLHRVLAIGIELDSGELNNTVSVDLSMTGCQVATSFPLPVGGLFTIHLHLRHLASVRGTARVVWCEELGLGLYRIGCQFEEIASHDDLARLYSFVDKEQLNADGLPPEHTPELELASQVTLRSLTEHELDRFTVLAHISEILNGSYDLQELLERTLRIAVEATGAERGIVLLSRGDSEFETPAFHAVSVTENRGFSRAVVEQVQLTGQPLLSLDAQKDERLSSSSSIRMMGTRSVLCLPMATRSRKFGMMYLDSSVRAGALTQSDLRLGTVIAGIAASAMERAESFALLVQREKLAAIGTLTAGFLHELGNPLASIMGLGELLHLDKPCQLTEDLMGEARRCQRLVKDLLRLTRQEPVALYRVQLSSVVELAVTAVSSQFEQLKVELKLSLPSQLPSIDGHQDHLRQVVLNLLSNAAYAAGRQAGGVVELQLAERGQELVLTVADNGPGIPREHLSKLFDPFFTTKDSDHGTGLGLSIIARIVGEHGGRVVAANRPEGGALFSVHLPITERQESMSEAG